MRVRRRAASLGEFGWGLHVGDRITEEIAGRGIDFCGSLVIAVEAEVYAGLDEAREDCDEAEGAAPCPKEHQTRRSPRKAGLLQTDPHPRVRAAMSATDH